MTNEKLQLNDPRLTAYALGELGAEEARAVKDAIGRNPELLALVEETKEAAAFLVGELAQEAQPRLTPAQRETIVPETTQKKGWFSLNAWVYSSLGLVAASVVAVLVMPRVLEQRPRQAEITMKVASREERKIDPGKAEVSESAQALAFAEKQAAQKPMSGGSMVSQSARPQLSPRPPVGAEYELNQVAADETAPSGASRDASVFAADRVATPEHLAKKTAEPSAPGQGYSLGFGNLGSARGAGEGASGAAALHDRAVPSQLVAKERVQMNQIVAPPGKCGGMGCMPRPQPMPGRGPYIPPSEGSSAESYPQLQENPWIKPTVEPLSTFSIDVDTASYANVRRMLNAGHLPPKDAVRIEEMVNYFPYNYAPPADGKPFAVHLEMAATPWTEGNNLVRIGLRGKDVPTKERPRLNLCFLIDVSGSMDEPNKLPLVQESLKLLVDQMQDQDRISLAVYAGASGLVLPPTSGDSKRKIKEAIDNLKAGGTTNGGSGIELAYQTVQQNFVKGGVNRVILATDGDFNVGVTNEHDLEKLIEQKAKGGAYLSVLGFGMGNYKDNNLVKLSDKGNGNYAYIDTLAEAKKALVEQMASTLITIAKDVKIQVEFNPSYVNAYRLVGYEKRLLNKEDFNDDTKDAGEIGSGHTVTAIYEVVPAGKNPPGSVDPLKYQKTETKSVETKEPGVKNAEALTVKLRYKDPESNTSKLIEVPLKNEAREFQKASADFQFAAAVAAFGMLLKGSEHKGLANFEPIAATAAKHTEVKGKESEYRKEFVELVRKANKLKNGPAFGQ